LGSGLQDFPTSGTWEVLNKHRFKMFKTLNFIGKLNKNKKKQFGPGRKEKVTSPSNIYKTNNK
jgi:hypothetical protein